MIYNFKIFESKSQEVESEFFKKLKDPKIFNEIKNFVETEIDPYCNNTIMTIFNNFNLIKNDTFKIKNLKTTEYDRSFTPGKYYEEDNGGYGGKISFFIVEDEISIIDSYFKLEIYGFSYKKRSGKNSTKLQTSIKDPQLIQLLHLSTLSKDDKIKFYIDQIDIQILKNIIKRVGIDKYENFNVTDREIREKTKWWLYEDHSFSTPLKKLIVKEAKKLGIFF